MQDLYHCGPCNPLWDLHKLGTGAFILGVESHRVKSEFVEEDHNRRSQEEDIHLGHAFARGCNAAAHKGAKDAPQMPALLHGPQRTPLPSPAPYLLPSTISRFERKYGRGTLLDISAFTPQDRYIPEGPEKIFFSNSVPLSSYFLITRLSGDEL